MESRIAYRGYTFDDVLLEPLFSSILPSEVDVCSRLTRNIPLNLPVVSSPMAGSYTHLTLQTILGV